jgi:hypothetical protein
MGDAVDGAANGGNGRILPGRDVPETVHANQRAFKGQAGATDGHDIGFAHLQREGGRITDGRPVNRQRVALLRKGRNGIGQRVATRGGRHASRASTRSRGVCIHYCGLYGERQKQSDCYSFYSSEGWHRSGCGKKESMGLAACGCLRLAILPRADAWCYCKSALFCQKLFAS